jgi:superfamily II DNA or RNA helicase
LTYLIAARKTNTLVLVHRAQLLDQWRERLAAFLDLPIDRFGQSRGGKRRAPATFDVALIQSLHRKGETKNLVAEYGHIVVDECHHLSAFTFEQVMRKVKADTFSDLPRRPFARTAIIRSSTCYAALFDSTCRFDLRWNRVRSSTG